MSFYVFLIFCFLLFFCIYINFFYFLENFKKFICNRCNRKYKYQTSLSRHIKYECGVSPQFQCQFCYKQFRYKNELKTHVIFVHHLIPTVETGP